MTLAPLHGYHGFVSSTFTIGHVPGRNLVYHHEVVTFKPIHVYKWCVFSSRFPASQFAALILRI